MAAEKLNQDDRIWEDDHGLLDEEQVAKCARADVAEPFRSPVPTRVISNGEYMPAPQTKEAEAGRGSDPRNRRRREQAARR